MTGGISIHASMYNDDTTNDSWCLPPTMKCHSGKAGFDFNTNQCLWVIRNGVWLLNIMFILKKTRCRKLFKLNMVYAFVCSVTKEFCQKSTDLPAPYSAQPISLALRPIGWSFRGSWLFGGAPGLRWSPKTRHIRKQPFYGSWRDQD